MKFIGMLFGTLSNGRVVAGHKWSLAQVSLYINVTYVIYSNIAKKT